MSPFNCRARSMERLCFRDLALVVVSVLTVSACTSSRKAGAAANEPATSSSAQIAAAGASGAASGHSAEPEHGHDHAGHDSQHHEREHAPAEHQHEHQHGGDGFHMDFSEVERFARHFDGPERDAWQMPAHVIELMAIKPGQTVADIGAGTGYFALPLSKAVGATGRVLALDLEPNMVKYIETRAKKEKLANVEARTVLPDDPQLMPASVDRILIVNTWHHIDQRPRYGEKLKAALKPDGALYVVDFTKESDIGPPANHRLSAQEVVAELASAGLKASVLTENLPKQYVVRGALK